MRKFVVAILAACSLAVAMPSTSQAHIISWGDTWSAIYWGNYGGLCGQGAAWQCRKSSMYADWQAPSGAHSRWVQGGFTEIHTLPWNPPWRQCRVLARFYHGSLAEVSYKSCA